MAASGFLYADITNSIATPSGASGSINMAYIAAQASGAITMFYLTTLATGLPGVSGVLWNNNGLLSIS